MHDMTSEANGVVDVAMGFDGRYAAHAATVISSIVHAAPGARFRFILLYADVPESAKKKCESVAPHCEFVWREVSDADLPPFADREHCFALAWNRSLLPIAIVFCFSILTSLLLMTCASSGLSTFPPIRLALLRTAMWIRWLFQKNGVW